MMEQVIFHCEDSMEGIFTAIYDGFVYKKTLPEPYDDSIEIAIGDSYEMTLFSTQIEVTTDLNKVEKTVKTIQNKLGYGIYERLIAALCHFREDRGSIVFGYLTRAFRVGPRIEEYLADPYVMQCFELSRKVYNEMQRMNGFLRFSDTGRFLFAEIEPKCNMIPMIMNHFVDRYRGENFVIYDHKRKLSYVHQANGAGTFVYGEDLHGYKGEGDLFEALWKQYFTTMAIKERKNERCQNNMLPKWYRKNMLEFQS